MNYTRCHHNRGELSANFGMNFAGDMKPSHCLITWQHAAASSVFIIVWSSDLAFQWRKLLLYFTEYFILHSELENPYPQMKATKLQNNTIFWFCDHLVYEPVPLRHGLTEAPLLTVATVLPTVAGVVLPLDNNDNNDNDNDCDNVMYPMLHLAMCGVSRVPPLDTVPVQVIVTILGVVAESSTV